MKKHLKYIQFVLTNQEIDGFSYRNYTFGERFFFTFWESSMVLGTLLFVFLD